MCSCTRGVVRQYQLLIVKAINGSTANADHRHLTTPPGIGLLAQSLKSCLLLAVADALATRRLRQRWHSRWW